MIKAFLIFFIVTAIVFMILIIIGSIFLAIGLYNISQAEQLRDEELMQYDSMRTDTKKLNKKRR